MTILDFCEIKMKIVKLIYTIMLLYLISTSISVAQDFKSLKLDEIILSDLSFKNVIRAFYSDKMLRVHVNDESFTKKIYVGLDTPKRLLEGQYSISPNNQVKLEIIDDSTLGMTEVTYEYVAYMDDIITYKNSNNEQRYLVPIITHAVSNGEIIQYRTSQGIIELFSFKKVKNGFQAVSRTPLDPYPTGTWGYPSWNAKEFFPHLKKMGKNLVGNYTLIDESLGQGYSESFWEIIHLPENNYIQIFYILAGESNAAAIGDEESPLVYDYSSDLSIHDDNSEYFPLYIHFKGDKKEDDSTVIKSIDHKSIFIFDKEKYEYIKKN